MALKACRKSDLVISQNSFFSVFFCSKVNVCYRIPLGVSAKTLQGQFNPSCDPFGRQVGHFAQDLARTKILSSPTVFDRFEKQRVPFEIEI